MENNEEKVWSKYSLFVLHELENLNKTADKNTLDIDAIKIQAAQSFSASAITSEKLKEICIWKNKIEDTISPACLADLVKEVDSLKVFKTKAITAFFVVNFIMGLILFFERILRYLQ